MVYQYPAKMLDVLGRKKRANEMARAVRYIKEIGAKFIIPSAGPPCFLDDGLFELNDFDGDPANTFPDATVFLDYMREHGYEHGRLMIPGTVATLTHETCEVSHPVPDAEVAAIFTAKRAYLEAYKARQQPRIDAIKASWPRGKYDIQAELKAWFEPLLQEADILAAGINGLVVLDLGASGVVLDFHTRTVYPWEGQEWDYYFKIDPALIEAEIEKRQEDWVNDLFLSCRFEAGRKGAYNEYVYIFFKCLTEERLQYAEGYYAEKAPEQQFFEAHGYRIQRRCPHLKADLERFAIIDENHILTCTMHGWQFELETGKCLTSDDRHLYSQKLDTPASQAPAEGLAAQIDAGPANLIRDRCHDCWYDAKKFKRTPTGAATGDGKD
jgi:UDP-MurNAc hydroxylase